MDNNSRESVINELQNSFEHLMTKYNIEDIGVFEEEGAKDLYHMGYTIRKDGKSYMVHTPYIKKDDGRLENSDSEWTIETDEPTSEDVSGFKGLDEALKSI
ncbi:hypothetical protein FS935_17845 [Metabacillus litoralis]|uniref:GK1464-like domain-containing protein n=1 Tax=Metabacillus litoralis TaxID=152268 RepID=A0A5C6VVT3_9BACI|nr:DUF5634 family protein [Metabacillus litoralis]TXC89337.1 hypothetical protein FS935_17845 [Metabacillus litoralis]